jgi:hypothetical protein
MVYELTKLIYEDKAVLLKGLIQGRLAKELYPVEGIMEDVFLFGDVRGTLVKRIES